MMKTLSLMATVALLCAIGFASPSAATTNLDGSTVTFQYYAYGGTYGSPTEFVAPNSTEFLGYFTVSVSGNQITYTYDSDATWSLSGPSLDSGGLYIDNGSLLSFSGAPAITSVKIDAASQLGGSGFNAGDVSFNSGAVAVTWMNEPFVQGDTVILDVNSSVPEPAAWAMMFFGLGLVGVGSRIARRKGGMALAA